MGYTTEFSGFVKLSRKLTLAEAKELLTFAKDPDNIGADVPHPRGYLQWVPSKTLDQIGWDDGEKFYDYAEWMTWVCGWLKARGIEACGAISYQGESAGDIGEILVLDNAVSVKEGKKSSSGFSPMNLRDLGEIALEQLTKEPQ
jgi:hypothetical protein